MTQPISAPALRMGPLEWLLLIILSILWGGSFFFNKLTVAEWPPFAVVQVRVGLAALALLLVVRIAGQSMAVGRELWLAFFGMGILNNLIPFSLFLWGQQQIASGLASILNATTPIFAVLVMHCFGNEKATGLKLGGVLAGLVGVAILMGPDALSGLGSTWRRRSPVSSPPSPMPFPACSAGASGACRRWSPPRDNFRPRP